MSYSNNPNLPKARAIGMKLLIKEGLPLQVVANKCGVHRSTVYRWKLKWLDINQNVDLANHYRPSRALGKQFRFTAVSWRIPTLNSRPKTSPKAISEEVVKLVLALRTKLNRCSEVIWFHLNQDYHIKISLNSVRRILKRHHYIDGRKKRVRPDNPRRPHVTYPGELVETDTIHHVDPKTGKRLYYYTVIDLFSRMTHVTLAPKLSPGLAAQAVLEARDKWGLVISIVQRDNGPEYGRYFEDCLQRRNITTRHTRLHRPNDNAHIERFNRTIQTECIGYYWNRSKQLKNQQDTLTTYLDYYNTRRVHCSLQYRTPIQMLQSS